MPRKLGQHFLKNKSALRMIAESLDLKPEDSIIEIGPGHGELTEFLRMTDASQIVLIEKDEKLCAALKEKFKGDGRIAMIEGDALKTLATTISDSRFAIRDYKIAGNIPYYITGHLFRVLSELEHKPKRCSFTIQKEVAERVCAVPPDMNRLAASVQFWATAKIIKTLPASDFSPPPKVSSAIIVLETTEARDINAKNYYAAVRALFAQPRKTLLNNLSKAVDQKGSVIADKLSKIGIVPNNRPQDLGVGDIITIARMFFG